MPLIFTFQISKPGLMMSPMKSTLSKSCLKYLVIILISMFEVLSNGTALAGESLVVSGLKFPNSPIEGVNPVWSQAMAADLGPSQLPGFSELTNYILPSPDQEDAGTCYYMSLTGIAEWWLARQNPDLSRRSEGPVDLSERFFINHMSNRINYTQSGVNNWITDGAYLLNATQIGILNKDYRFTKGWFTEGPNGKVYPSNPGVPSAQYGTKFNWVDDSSQAGANPISLPRFERDVLFINRQNNLWSVGEAPSDIVDRVKSALLKRKSPIHLIYNHLGYWHAVIVLGFDDTGDTENCEFTEYSRKYFKGFQEPGPYIPVDDLIFDNNPFQLQTTARFDSTSQALEKAYRRGGGCNSKGIFYVRDSQYSDQSEDNYIYDLSNQNTSKPYSRRLIKREYVWLKYLASSAVQIYLKD